MLAVGEVVVLMQKYHDFSTTFSMMGAKVIYFMLAVFVYASARWE